MYDATRPPPDPSGDETVPRARTLVRRWGTWGGPLILVAGLALVAQAAVASSDVGPPAMALGGHAPHLAPAAPPEGTTWIEGVITDQADHGQDNVNVEAWANDPTATAPVASSLTYGGPPDGLTYAHGFFLLEVPSGRAYRLVFSAVGNREDGDLFRMKRYGHGRPIMVRTALAGRIRDLGVVALARQGKVASATTAHLVRARVTSAKRAKLKVTVTSRFVTDVTGKVVVQVKGKRVVARLTKADHDKAVVRLPRLRHPGSYRVRVGFRGSDTVHRSSAHPVKLRVRRSG
jgi:hypothetical protein